MSDETPNPEPENPCGEVKELTFLHVSGHKKTTWYEGITLGDAMNALGFDFFRDTAICDGKKMDKADAILTPDMLITIGSDKLSQG